MPYNRPIGGSIKLPPLGELPKLPGRLLDAGDLPLVRQLPEADTAHAVVAQIGVGAAADFAAVIFPAGELRLRLLL